MKVRVTFIYEPEEDEVDEGHESGLTSDGYDALFNALMPLGAEDVEAEKA